MNINLRWRSFNIVKALRPAFKFIFFKDDPLFFCGRIIWIACLENDCTMYMPRIVGVSVAFKVLSGVVAASCHRHWIFYCTGLDHGGGNTLA